MYLAIDIGGTKTLLAIFSESGEIIEKIKFETPQNYPEFLKVLEINVAKLTTKEFISAVMACPGKVDYSVGRVIVFGNLEWENTPLKADVEQIIKTPVYLENDGNLAGLSEAIALRDTYSKLVYLTVSTGIGGGICVDGRIMPDLRHNEPGWIMLEHEGQMLPWEKFASGKAIVAKYGQRASEITDPGTWKEISEMLAKGIFAILAIIQPDVIVIGGGVGSHFAKFEEPLNAALKKYETPLVTIPPIQQAKYPEDVVIYGCYEFARQHAKAD